MSRGQRAYRGTPRIQGHTHILAPSHLDTVETAKPRRTFHDTAEAFHVIVETFYDTVAPSMAPPGGRFEYLTSSRVRQSSSFFTASTKTARRRKQPVTAEEASKPRADSPSRKCGRSNAEARARKVPKAAKYLLRKMSAAG
jgi:hypothetical protein